MAIKIAVANQKGGVGKTTTSVNLAAGLALAGNRVLIIDMDPQAHTTKHLMPPENGEKPPLPEITVEHVMKKEVEAQNATLETPIDTLYLLASNSNLSDYEAELGGGRITNREYKLQKAVSELEAHLDYIVIDCPPSLDWLAINSLAASDYVLIVTETEYLSAEGVDRLFELVEIVKEEEINPEIKPLGILLNGYNPSIKVHKRTRDKLQAIYPSLVFAAYIRKNIRLSDGPELGLPIQLYDARCNGAKDFQKLTSEVIKRCQSRRAQ